MVVRALSERLLSQLRIHPRDRTPQALDERLTRLELHGGIILKHLAQAMPPSFDVVEVW